MRTSTLSSRACAILSLALSATAVTQNLLAAGYTAIYGGPMYSDATGGYRVNADLNSTGNSTAPRGIVNSLDTFPAFYGAVNDAGVATGNVLRVDSPLTTTPENAVASVARWSATSAPTFLDAPSPNVAIFARGINNAGSVIGGIDPNYACQLSATGGSASGGSGLNPAQWNASGAVTVLSALGSTTAVRTIGAGINDQGIGICSTPSVLGGASRAGRWDTSSMNAAELTVPNGGGGFTGPLAFAINDSGVAVGQFQSFGQGPAMRWDAGQTAGTILPDLGHPSGAHFDSAALAINSTGTAVGYSTLYSASGASLGFRPVIWDSAGSITQLGDWASANGHATNYTYALAINDSGVVVGNDDWGHGLRWNPGSSTPIVLAGLSPLTFLDATAFAINSQGTIVGDAETSVGQTRAVYWNPDGSVVDLNSLIDPSSGWTLKIASAISDTGWILGVGSFDPDGAGPQTAYDRLFILGVPEPTSLELVVAASICFVGYLRVQRV